MKDQTQTLERRTDNLTSISRCQCAMGFRGYDSISLQCSRPRLSASVPTLQTPITSLCPTLKVREEEKKSLGF